MPFGKLVFGTSALTTSATLPLADGRGFEPRLASQPDLRLASECLATRPPIRELELLLPDDESLDIHHSPSTEKAETTIRITISSTTMNSPFTAASIAYDYTRLSRWWKFTIRNLWPIVSF